MKSFGRSWLECVCVCVCALSPFIKTCYMWGPIQPTFHPLFFILLLSWTPLLAKLHIWHLPHMYDAVQKKTDITENWSKPVRLVWFFVKSVWIRFQFLKPVNLLGQFGLDSLVCEFVCTVLVPNRTGQKNSKCFLGINSMFISNLFYCLIICFCILNDIQWMSYVEVRKDVTYRTLVPN